MKWDFNIGKGNISFNFFNWEESGFKKLATELSKVLFLNVITMCFVLLEPEMHAAKPLQTVKFKL